MRADTMKLQKRFAYKYRDKNHYKYIITIPEQAISKLGLNEGDNLEPIVRGGKIILQPSELREKKE
jgi:AbrB family looped-hinge helix DNA binding protein